MSNQKIGVIGLGHMGRIYVKALISLGYKPCNIIGYDIDPRKAVGVADDLGIAMAYSVKEAVEQTPVVVVATNTPSHPDVLEEASSCGATHLFCEKPLGMSAEETERLSDLDATIFTAFLINFSPAVEAIVQVMQSESLMLREGSVMWGKNRLGNNRPTPGDLEDESVHGLSVLKMLANINGAVAGIDVAAQLTHMDYVDHEAQAQARVHDASFPEPADVNSSTHAIVKMYLSDLQQDDELIPLQISLYSSYIMAKQVRTITGILGASSADTDLDQPAYAFHIDFDVPVDRGGVKDVLTLTRSKDNDVRVSEFAGVNKISLEIEAFLQVVHGHKQDVRLTDLSAAQAAVAISDAIRYSSQNNATPTKVT